MGSAAELGFSAAWRVVRALPMGVTAPFFAAAATVTARRNGRGVQRLAGNLRRVVGPDMPKDQLDALVRRGMRSYTRYWQEAFKLPAFTPERVRGWFHLYGEDAMAEAVAAGKGVVIALPHAGNWDAAGAWVAAKGWPITTVQERLKPEGVFEKFLEFRRKLGMEILPLTGGERPPLDILAERLKEGAVVPLLADRDLTRRGVDVTFFGGRARMPAGPALLALRTGAPLYVAHLWYEPDRPVAEFDGPVEPPADGSLDARVRELTQRVADRLAVGIARHPEDWHMLQRVWLAETAAEPIAGPAPEPA